MGGVGSMRDMGGAMGRLKGSTVDERRPKVYYIRRTCVRTKDRARLLRQFQSLTTMKHPHPQAHAA